MPYRLIYTGETQPGGAPLPGCGVEARSELMPPALVSYLTEPHRDHCPGGAQGITGSRYTYHTEEIAGGIQHILTVVSPIGSGHTYRAQHLVLSQKEVQTACALSAEPLTPARMAPAAALLDPGAPAAVAAIISSSLPAEEHYLSRADSAWQELTGSAAHAQLLLAEPYRRGCIVTVPPGTDSLRLLRLLHESQQLSPILGWGIPFSTSAAEGEEPDARRYTFTTPGSPLHLLARRSACPVLELHHPHLPGDSTRPIRLSPRPYFYCECSDDDTFTTPWRSMDCPPLPAAPPPRA